MRNLIEDTRSPGHDSNRAPPEYASRALPLYHSVRWNNSVMSGYDQIDWDSTLDRGPVGAFSSWPLCSNGLRKNPSFLSSNY
jgi:hypothetical protein